MANNGNVTFSYHASARLAAASVVDRQRTEVAEEFDTGFLDALVQPLLITNPERQIVFINRSASARFGVASLEAIGKRPGDVIGCVHVEEAPAGCGTGLACRSCGWTNALLAADRGESAAREASLLLHSGEAIDAVINAVPVTVRNTRYTINEIADVSAQRRREQLEQTFFHDVLNVAAAVKGLIELNCAVTTGHDESLSAALKASTDRLIDEIRTQRTMSDAQDGRLNLTVDTMGVESAVTIAMGTVMQMAGERGIALRAFIAPDTPLIRTDHTLLGRILTNLAKNAVEASERGAEVTIEAYPSGDKVSFSVHNASAIPEMAQRHLFHRAHSTKGADRGVGTFSVKLLTEQYLQGTVQFSSDESSGTRFTVSLPVNLGVVTV